MRNEHQHKVFALFTQDIANQKRTTSKMHSKPLLVLAVQTLICGSHGLSLLPRLTTSRPISSRLHMAVDNSNLTPRQFVEEGMNSFRRGDMQGSIDNFDASVPPGFRGYLWQRGISYYYAENFAAGSQQFRDDVVRSPLDVEEIVWDIACLLRMDPTFPPPKMLSLPLGKKDRRPIMVSFIKKFVGRIIYKQETS